MRKESQSSHGRVVFLSKSTNSQSSSSTWAISLMPSAMTPSRPTVYGMCPAVSVRRDGRLVVKEGRGMSAC